MRNALWGLEILENPCKEGRRILVLLGVGCGGIAVLSSRLVSRLRSGRGVHVHDDLGDGEDGACASDLRIRVHQNVKLRA